MFVFIETKLFTRLVTEYLADEDFAELQATLLDSPELGKLIPGSGGIRKVRWRTSGRGKRGGYRVIYYVRTKEDEIWLLTIYPKNVVENIPAGVLKKIRDEIENG